MGWISRCVRNGREPVRARASADTKEAPRLSAENRREAYVPESWCPPVGSPRRYILRKGAKGGVRGTARGKTRFPAWVRRSSALAPPEQCQPAGWRAEAGLRGSDAELGHSLAGHKMPDDLFVCLASADCPPEDVQFVPDLPLLETANG